MNRPSHDLQGAQVPQGTLGILVWGANIRNSFKLGLSLNYKENLLQVLWDMLQNSGETGPAKGPEARTETRSRPQEVLLLRFLSLRGCFILTHSIS